MQIILLLIGILIHPGIDTVVIYNNQSRIIRTTTVHIRGEDTLYLTSLPWSTDNVSVSAKGLEIEDVGITKNYAKSPTTYEKSLIDSIDTLTFKKSKLEASVQSEQTKQKFIQTISSQLPGQAAINYHNPISAETLRGILNLIGTESQKSGLKILKLQRKIAELDNKINILKDKLKDIRSRNPKKKTIRIIAFSRSSSDYHIKIAYNVQGGRWTPRYNIKALIDAGKLELTAFASVFQNTGEDWKNCHLLLSTASPIFNIRTPKVNPWYIYKYRRIQAARSSSRDKAYEKEAAPMLQATGWRKPSSPIEQGVSLQYAVPYKHTVKSGGSPAQITITKNSFTAHFNYLIIPRLLPKAFLEAHFKNNTKYIFMQGYASTFVGNDYTGKTMLSNLTPSDSATIYPGTDDRIKVERKLIEKKVRKSGLGGKTIVREFTYENTVTNLHKTPIDITMVEEVPVSTDADIKITYVKFSVSPDRSEKGMGIFYWNRKLNGGQKLTVRVSFAIKSPAHTTLSGI